MGSVVPGVLAFVLGSAVAVAALVPWTALEYRRHGRLGLRRSLVAFGTVVYALALVTYTLLPLPDVSTMCATPASVQLTPLAFVRDVVREGGIGGPRSLLTNPAAAQVLLNVVLFVPLGALARHAVARRRPVVGLVVGLGAGFVVSLLVELTQLTGDWFLYPCAYRLFDVDDLLANTAGAVVGTVLAPLVGLLAGSRDPVDADEPRPVTSSRRFVGMFSDVLAIWLLSSALTVGTSLAWALADRDDQDPSLAALVTIGGLVAPALQLVVVLASGRTLGEHVVRLRPTPSPGALARVVRWALGSGGWATLIALDGPFLPVVAFALAVTSVVAVRATRGRRGLALAVLRLDVEDDRVSAGGDRAPWLERQP
ncbi:VanZ family protein [Frigoribacterium sp. Leaf186]|uniref:VanZ family protein n=1 Tax=Frigoribacterium sp. Leaf186 TaxID=1736293 RepID=UPI0006F8427D|nr:VanZ family protein [Frigoribacterium sp. Leaf186]KQS17653.1 hypothetical protein ASG05_09515 [Frigoribacterium sp. Leaf186]